MLTDSGLIRSPQADAHNDGSARPVIKADRRRTRGRPHPGSTCPARGHLPGGPPNGWGNDLRTRALAVIFNRLRTTPDADSGASPSALPTRERPVKAHLPRAPGDYLLSVREHQIARQLLVE